MTHDVAHCLDYEENKCPESCYKAQVTEDFFKLDEVGSITFPTSWEHFKGTSGCKIGVLNEKTN